VLTMEVNSEAITVLEKAKEELQRTAVTTESQIRSVALAFRGLAGQTDEILNLAAAIVGCVESESVSSILPKVQGLGAAARKFIGDRLQATAGLLEAVATEVKVLRELSEVTGQQAEIALKTKALSVLTNVEVAHLGTMGAGFQYLARELAEFSKSLIADAKALETHMDSRKTTIEETRRALSTELPRLREKLGTIEEDLGKDLSALNASLTHLSNAPAQFRMCVEDIARQIAGVVSAVQAHDITRQQSEHIEEAFDIISDKLHSADRHVDGASRDLPDAYAGITIQIYQLQSVRVTVEHWTSQIKECMDGIRRVSASEMSGIGPMVLAQEADVSSQLAHIESLERESQACSLRIQRTLDGLSGLMQFVTEHVQRSRSIRDRLRLLSFNSIIEASRLGTKADAVLAIAKTIKEISGEWSEVADRSWQAMEEMQMMAKETETTREAFSEASNEKLREAQEQTRAGLENLRTAAAFAASRSKEMESITGKMQAQSAEVSGNDNLLETCTGKIDALVSQLESMKLELERNNPGMNFKCDEKVAEQMYAASYSTEMEREVMQAALRGMPLPGAKPMLGGNSVELF
jgi:hypothetical protein